MVNQNSIREKFGDDYMADECTFRMGIDQRFTAHIAGRFRGYRVLETCTGAGFATIALARTAKHVFTVEIDKSHLEQAVYNIERAGLSSSVTFIHGSILGHTVLSQFSQIDAVFIDPDWAVNESGHVFRFKDSNMKPPADILLNAMFRITENVAMIMPPLIDVDEFENLPVHEREKLYLGENHELYCLYFGKLIRFIGEVDYCVRI